MAPPPSTAALEQATSRVFTGLSARPSEAGLPPSKELRDAIEPDSEICEHAKRRLRLTGDAAMRRRDVRRWLRSALSAFGPAPVCHVAVGPVDSVWMRVETGDRIDWLADLALTRDDGAPRGHETSPVRSRQGDGVEDLMIVSEDRTRALILRTAEDELFSYLSPFRELVDRAESIARLRAAFPKAPGTRLWRPTWSRCVPAAAMREGPATAERVEPASDRQGSFTRAFAALAEADRRAWESRPEDDRGPDPATGGWLVATGTLGTLAWLGVNAGSASWAEALWDAAALDRLFVRSLHGDHALGLFSRGETLVGIVNRLEEMWAA